MADADYTTDAGMDALAAHRRGECSGPCPWCMAGGAPATPSPTPADLARTLREIAARLPHTLGCRNTDALEAAAQVLDRLAAEAPAVLPAPVPPRKRGRQ